MAAPPHRRTAAPPHRRTAAPPHRRTAAPPHRRTAAPPHRRTAAPPPGGSTCPSAATRPCPATRYVAAPPGGSTHHPRRHGHVRRPGTWPHHRLGAALTTRGDTATSGDQVRGLAAAWGQHSPPAATRPCPATRYVASPPPGGSTHHPRRHGHVRRPGTWPHHRLGAALTTRGDTAMSGDQVRGLAAAWGQHSPPAATRPCPATRYVASPPPGGSTHHPRRHGHVRRPGTWPRRRLGAALTTRGDTAMSGDQVRGLSAAWGQHSPPAATRPRPATRYVASPPPGGSTNHPRRHGDVRRPGTWPRRRLGAALTTRGDTAMSGDQVRGLSAAWGQHSPPAATRPCPATRYVASPPPGGSTHHPRRHGHVRRPGTWPHHRLGAALTTRGDTAMSGDQVRGLAAAWGQHSPPAATRPRPATRYVASPPPGGSTNHPRRHGDVRRPGTWPRRRLGAALATRGDTATSGDQVRGLSAAWGQHSPPAATRPCPATRYVASPPPGGSTHHPRRHGHVRRPGTWPLRRLGAALTTRGDTAMSGDQVRGLAAAWGQHSPPAATRPCPATRYVASPPPGGSTHHPRWKLKHLRTCLKIAQI